LVDSNGTYIWSPGLIAGSPDTLLGSPVYTDTNLHAIATGNWPIVYGNFNRGFFVRIAGGVRVESSNAPGFTQDLESFRFIVRGGSVLVDLNALRKLAMA
jgi:HK97 family phage major capsid protein